MDFHSITDPYIPSWVKAEVQGAESLFDCNDGCSSMPVQMDDNQNQNEHFVENDYSNSNPINVNINDVPSAGNGNMSVIEDHNLLWPVSPLESGEGLPYAPIDWPNPGDNWTWRVGKRVNNAGYFQDRFLYLPKNLPMTPGGPKSFASKAAVESYLRTNFPEADVAAFFGSFSWKIPAKIETPTKVEAVPISTVSISTVPVQLEATPQDKTETVQEDTKKPTPRYSQRERKQRIEKVSMGDNEVEGVQEDKKKPTPRYSQRERKQKIEKVGIDDEVEESVEVPRSTGRKRKQNAATPSSSTPKQKPKGPSRRSSRSAAANQSEQLQEPVVDLIPEDFDNYLNSLEDILAQPLSEAPVYNSALIDPSIPNDEMFKARSKLSSLLQKDFQSLITTKNVTQLTTLASKLRMDPTLTADQLVKLKLIDELPLFIEVYSESKQTLNQVAKFFATLEANKTKVASMKNEYSELKEKTDELQTQIDSNFMAVREIDNHIAQLKARRAELTKMIETNKAAKDEVSFTQKMVASSIPNVVHEIQVSNSKIPEMDLKRINAEKREAEILDKFAPLRGFYL